MYYIQIRFAFHSKTILFLWQQIAPHKSFNDTSHVVVYFIQVHRQTITVEINSN